MVAQGGFVPEEGAAHPCAFLCIECGYLTPPGNRPADRCPHCRAQAWVDLATDAALQSMLELDTNEALARLSGPARAFRRMVVTMLAVVCAVSVLVMFGIYAEAAFMAGPFLLALLGIGAVVSVFVFAGAARADFARTRSKRFPARWSMVRPPGSATVSSDMAFELHRDGDLIAAPLTGRPCLAYEVGIRRDGDATGAPGTWLLLEQRSGAVRAGAWSTGPNGLGFASRRERVTPDAMRREQIDRYLRERGLTPDEPYMFFETVLMPGTAADVAEIPGANRLFAHVPPRRRRRSGVPRPAAARGAEDNPYSPPRG